ncbi:MAG: hypothetical protein ABRQ39_23110 [Candidatus Eremiobacterota bacterium]
MQINQNKQTFIKKPDVSPYSISEETMKEFPNLTGKDCYLPHKGNNLEIGRNIIPVSDQIYIEKRSKELKAELTAIPERMKNLHIGKNIGATVFLAGVGAVLGAGPIGLILGTISLRAATVLAGGGVTAALVGSLGMATSDNAMHKNWLKYYDNRTELEYLNRGKLWTPRASYIAPDPEADAIAGADPAMAFQMLQELHDSNSHNSKAD